MKVLLINPYFNGVVWAPTMGLGFIGTYIKNNSDCDIEILEPGLENLTEKEVLEKTKNADIVGLTCYTESRFECFGFAEKVKQINPDCKIIVGGPHVDKLDIEILKHYKFVDIIVRMEGEKAFFDIINNKPLEKIGSITWRDKDVVKRNLDGPLIENINDLDYDYSLVWNQIKKWKDLEVPRELQKRNHIPIIVSRGCPFRCAFCGSFNHWGKTVRCMDEEKIVEKMEFLADKYKIGYFRFYDALFIGNEKKILNFCDILEKRKLDISFRIDLRVGTPRNVLEKLKHVGCDVVGFGVESGSDKILKRLNKGITRSMILDTIKNCKDLKYWSIGFFMVSLPDETLEDMKMTFGLFKYFDAYNYQFFKIHPNTTIYEELKQRGEINDEIWFDKSIGSEIFYCKDNFPSALFSKKEISLIVTRMYFDFNSKYPKNTFKRYGFKSFLIYPLSLVSSLSLKTKIGQQAFYNIETSKLYDKIIAAYRKLYRL